jgi:ABC-type transporter MlaC component
VKLLPANKRYLLQYSRTFRKISEQEYASSAFHFTDSRHHFRQSASDKSTLRIRVRATIREAEAIARHAIAFPS